MIYKIRPVNARSRGWRLYTTRVSRVSVSAAHPNFGNVEHFLKSCKQLGSTWLSLVFIWVIITLPVRDSCFRYRALLDIWRCALHRRNSGGLLTFSCCTRYLISMYIYMHTHRHSQTQIHVYTYIYLYSNIYIILLSQYCFVYRVLGSEILRAGREMFNSNPVGIFVGTS